PGDMLEIVGPSNRSKIGQPTRKRHVADVSTAFSPASTASSISPAASNFAEAPTSSTALFIGISVVYGNELGQNPKVRERRLQGGDSRAGEFRVGMAEELQPKQL